MKQHFYLKYTLVLTFNLVCLFSATVKAQVVPDSSLQNKSTVIQNQNINGTPSDLISGGTIRGANLFHSFQDFNVQADHGVYFANPLGITNIFTRVTGGTRSNILGTIGVLGQANLFFLNPNGILFGSNARLDLNGSFLATTATSFKWRDENQLSANNPQDVPSLLTIKVPIGLNFTGNSGSIEVQGVGHTLSTFSLFSGPTVGAGTSTTGLRVQPGKNIALVGGKVIFDGGIATAPAGNVEIASIDVGQVKLNPFSISWTLDYSSVQNFQNIQLTNLSLLDASGTGTGNISLHGSQVDLLKGSYALIQSQGLNSGGNININATQSLSLTGNTSLNPSLSPEAAKVRTGIVSENFLGQGASINITTKDLVLQSAGGIATSSLFSGYSGNILINALNSVQIKGASIIDPFSNFSVVSTTSGGVSNSGNITISTANLSVQDGGSILSTTFGSGYSGNLNITALQSFLIRGFRDVSQSVAIRGFTFLNSAANVPSAVASSSYGTGDAGNITINTPQLSVLDGASISTSTVASGKAGNININAPNFIKVSGFFESKGLGSQTIYPTLITSSSIKFDPLLQNVLNLPLVPSGNAGTITIKTGNLLIDKIAQVSVRNDGTGDAGALNINANSVDLDNQGVIAASTVSGKGGDINLHLAKQLYLDHNSIISATAGGQGKGGNITIDPQQTIISNGSGIAVNSIGTGNAGQLTISGKNLILNNGAFLSANTNGGEGGNIFLNARNLQLRHKSSITATATGGSGGGGNITIGTATLVALENSDITANAQGGAGGRVTINAQGIFRSPDSEITATGGSPQLNGTVQINTPDIDPSRGLLTLPTQPVNITGLIAQGCSAIGPHANKFVVTGRGGIPENPNEKLGDDTVWADLRWIDTSHLSQKQPKQPSSVVSVQPNPANVALVPATGWVFNTKGQVTLTANATLQIPWMNSATCRAL